MPSSKPFARSLFWVACLAIAAGSARMSDAVTYSTILDATEDQTPQGVRGAGRGEITMAREGMRW